MMRAKLFLVAAGVLAFSGASGCMTVSPTVRAQSPDGEIQQTAHYNQPVKAAADAMADCYHEHHATSVTYYGPNHHGHGAYCPPGYGGHQGHFGHHGGFGHHGQNACPSGHCPSGHCPGQYGGNELNWYPHHGFSYSYEVPNDLRYPQANAVGGAVVYPYYTHKGPSDFFRAE